ncbi:uncharacterized protein LOC135819520 [Sycon ciliatum]|uniref:uncharacterized protein LOC135819520 n=1 Tax=Sycon ciliatum TaxID=27933 RepID=UPI0020AB0659|eukprot:scpid8959/ scgid34340/ 
MARSEQTLFVVVGLCLSLDLALMGSAQSSSSCAAPVSHNLVLAQQTCSCRSSSTCPRSATGLPALKKELCPDALANSPTRVQLEGHVECTSDCQIESVQVWQADPNGRYSAHSQCSAYFTERDFVAHAPVPGVVVEGHQAKHPVDHVGFVHVLVKTVGGEYVSEQFRYPGFPYSMRDVAASKLMACTQTGEGEQPVVQGVDLRSTNVTCRLPLTMNCAASTESDRIKIRTYVNHVQSRTSLPSNPSAEHSHEQPNMAGCPKLKDIRHFYNKGSLAIIVEPIGPDMVGPNCQVMDLPKEARAGFGLQSTYVALIKEVLKEPIARHNNSYAGMSADLTVSTGHPVQIQYALDTRCCRELMPGERYLVIGIPLPLVGNSNRQTSGKKVFRVWADSVFESGKALRTLLRQRLN